MKVIDHTPFFNADGKISMVDQARATMKFGAAWLQETRAQVNVMAALDRNLDKKYTLLRNVTLQGLEISIPFILVGPTGIYAMYVTALHGMFRAKGDAWGTLAGNNFKPANPNLMTRTARMAKAVQVYLERQGYTGLGMVESAVLCADPGMHVDSVRPMVRVVQSDALERFGASIAQGRALLSMEVVTEVISRIMNPRKAKAEEEAAAAGAPAGEVPVEEADPYVPAFALPEEPGTAGSSTAQPAGLDFAFHEETAPLDETPFGTPEQERVRQEQKRQAAQTAGQARPRQRKKSAFSTRQWVLLILVAVVECALLGIFLFLVSQNL